MIALRRTSRFSRIVGITTVMAMLLVAVALVGCGGTKESPGGPSGTGAPEKAEALKAPADVQNAATAALKAAGYSISDPMYVYVNYESAAKTAIIVSGSFKGPKGEPLTWAKLSTAGGKLAIAEVR